MRPNVMMYLPHGSYFEIGSENQIKIQVQS